MVKQDCFVVLGAYAQSVRSYHVFLDENSARVSVEELKKNSPGEYFYYEKAVLWK